MRMKKDPHILSVYINPSCVCEGCKQKRKRSIQNETGRWSRASPSVLPVLALAEHKSIVLSRRDALPASPTGAPGSPTQRNATRALHFSFSSTVLSGLFRMSLSSPSFLPSTPTEPAGGHPLPDSPPASPTRHSPTRQTQPLTRGSRCHRRY
jgi:hypothetical protein